MNRIIPFLNANKGRALLVLGFVFLSVKGVLKGGDFDVFIHAAHKLQGGLNLYVQPFHEGLQYYYSVFFAWILLPFHTYALGLKLFWALASLVMLVRAYILARGYLQLDKWTQKTRIIFGLLLLILSFQFIHYNLHKIQITLFLLWGIMESVHQAECKRPWLAGIILALVINIKIMPLLVLPYLLYRGYFKASAWTVVFSVVYLYSPAIYLGWEENNCLLTEWWKIINPTNREHVFEVEIGGHSLSALIPVLITDTPLLFETKRNFLQLSEGTTEIILNCSRLLLAGITFLFLRSWPFQKEESPLKRFWELSYVICLIPLIFPHQQKYALLLTLPLVMYLLYFFFEARRRGFSKGEKIALSFFVAAMLCYSPLYGRDLIGRFLFEFTQYFRLLTFATLTLIPIAVYCRPDKLPA